MDEEDYLQNSEQPLEQASYPYGTMIQSKEEKESSEIGIIKGLSPKEVLENIRMEMRGYYWDYVKKKYDKIEGMHPMMNDLGIAKYLSIVSTFVSDLVTFSNFNEEQISKVVIHICDEVFPVIAMNWREYGIPTKSDIIPVNLKIFITSWSSFNKALGAGDRGVVRGVTTENILQRGGYPQMPVERKGFLSKINPFGR